MKALTVKQPWPYAVFHLGKDIENRDWDTRLRGTIAIHSSKKVNRSDYLMSAAAIAHIVGDISKVPMQADLPHGYIVGLVDIVDCVDHSDSPWFFGDYGFVIRNAVALPEPIACSGALGFWDVPDRVLEEINRQLSEIRNGVNHES